MVPTVTLRLLGAALLSPASPVCSPCSHCSCCHSGIQGPLKGCSLQMDSDYWGLSMTAPPA